jgi:hypothetical protein
MNWFRVIGVFIAVIGAGIFILFLWRSMPVTNSNAGVGTVPVTALLFGILLFAVGLIVAFTGGRQNESRG